MKFHKALRKPIAHWLLILPAIVLVLHLLTMFKDLLSTWMEKVLVKLREVPLTALCAAQQQTARTSPAGCSVGAGVDV